MSEKFSPLGAISEQVDALTPKQGLPPVDLWNPPLNGDLDMRIKRDGVWLYQGTPIERPALVRLFSTILKREGDDYFLVTPVEKWRIQVDDVPLHAIAVREKTVDGQPVLEFETLTGDVVIASAAHPLRVVVDGRSGEPSPYIRVRSSLDALISRNVFYQLVDKAKAEENAGVSQLVVCSAGERFVLGNV